MHDDGPDDAQAVTSGLALKALQADCPAFRIWREITGDRARYISRSLHADIGPHTVVTDDLAELREELEHVITRPQPVPGQPSARQPATPAADMQHGTGGP